MAVKFEGAIEDTPTTVGELMALLAQYPINMIVAIEDHHFGEFVYSFELELKSADRIFGIEDVPIKRQILVIR